MTNTRRLSLFVGSLLTTQYGSAFVPSSSSGISGISTSLTTRAPLLSNVLPTVTKHSVAVAVASTTTASTSPSVVESRLFTPQTSERSTSTSNASNLSLNLSSSTNAWMWIPLMVVAARELLGSHVTPVVSLVVGHQDWHMNLVKHVLTMGGMAVCVSACRDLLQLQEHSKKTTGAAPISMVKCAVAMGCLVFGVEWMQQRAFVSTIPYYGINLIKHTMWLWTTVASVSLVGYLRGQPQSRPRLPKTVVSGVAKEEQKDRLELMMNATAADGDFLASTTTTVMAIEDEMEAVPQRALQATTSISATTSKEFLLSFTTTESMSKIILHLAKLQDHLAEFQLETIPAVFSPDKYLETQDRITNYQMTKIPEMFRTRKEEDP